MLTDAVSALAPTTGVAAACRLLAVPRARYYRRRPNQPPAVQRQRPQPARALLDAERQAVLGGVTNHSHQERSQPRR